MVLVVVFVVLVILGGTAALLLTRSRRKTVDDSTVSSADRIHDSYVGVAEASTPAPDGSQTTEADTETAGAEVEPAEVEVDEQDEAAAARFRLPGERSTTSAFGPPVLEPLVKVRHLELPAAEVPTAAPPAPDTPAPPTPEARPTAVDDVVSALVERVRTSDEDVMSVVSDMVEQDLDTEQMEEVLTELVERDRSARAESEELTLTGPDVPQRPGRLSAFADMPEQQKRRVIIRVLCLLIARSEEHEPVGDDRPEHTVELPDETAEPTARDLWGEPEADARDAHLPARRRRLARTPR